MEITTKVGIVEPQAEDRIEKTASRPTWSRFGLGLLGLSLVALGIQFFTPHAESDKGISVTSATFPKPIEVDHESIIEVTLTNNSDEALEVCGNTGRCSDKYCVFVAQPLPFESLASGAKAQVRIKYKAGVPGPFSAEIALYCCCKSSMVTVSVRVSGVAVASVE